MSILSAYALPQDFRQPYPIGSAMKNPGNFIGTAYFYHMPEDMELNIPMFNITCEPCCRSNWHRHSGGQIIIATAGIGYYQEFGQPARRLFPGDIVEVAPGVEHWQGAAPDSWFAHVTLECNFGDNKTIWNVPVADDSYFFAVRNSAVKYEEADSLLSSRQRSIVTIGVYAGKGDMEHIDTAFIDALDAGMTINEIKELLVQAYAYAGFPRSLSALVRFKALVERRTLAGFTDIVGPEPSQVPHMDDKEKYALGKKNIELLSGTSADAPNFHFSSFAPLADKFIVEHIYADIFSRDILPWRDRELATVSIIAGVGDAEPMAAAHMGICVRLGITPSQLTALLNIVEAKAGKKYSTPLRPYIHAFIK